MLKDLIWKWALKNAIDHSGKCMDGAVISKVLGEKQELINDMKTLAQEVSKVTKEVNGMDVAEQLAKLEDMYPQLLEKKGQKGLGDLPNAIDGKVSMMFPPEPSKFPTLGHGKACFLNYLFAKKYNGKFGIRFEDTNANKVKEEYYAQFLKDLEWLGIEWDYIDYISDHIEEMYEFVEKLITDKNAYMCNCPSEKVRKLREKKEACLCRETPPEESEHLWKDMLDKKFKEGEYSLRIKIDMKHKNAAMRDPAVMRTVIGTHPRKGDNFIVWPTYDFATSVMDSIEGITHRLRSKEFEQRAEVQRYIQKVLDMKSPTVMEFARFNIEGVPSSGRIIREMIEKGELIGWDDPRVPTLKSLRLRGFEPKAIENFSVNTGISKAESTITWEVLEAENKKIIENSANRYFMVRDKVKMIVRGVPEDYKVNVRLHPTEDRGVKEYEFKGKEAHVFVNKSDFLEKKQGDSVRLMDFGNVKLDVVSTEEIVAEFKGKEHEKGVQIIQWVSPEGAVDIQVMMTDGEVYYGLAESAARNLEEGDIIQFIRFGFCKLNEKQDELLKFRFTHN